MKERTNCIFIVYAQVYENKGYPSSEDWRPKGRQEFSLKINYSDYDKYGIRDPWNNSEELVSIFKMLVKHESDELYNYEYIDYDLWFGNPMRLNKDRFYAYIESYIEEINNDI